MACGRGNGPSTLLVFAATSLTDALTEIEAAFEGATGIEVLLSYGGSQALARQIQSGAPADVFISAGAGPVNFLENTGRISTGSRRPLLLNRLVVVSHSQAPSPTSVEDLTLGDYGKVALANPDLAPAGEYAREALVHQRVYEKIRSKILFGADVRATLTYVESGNADAGLVYATDARSAPGLHMSDVVPMESYTPIVYPTIAVTGSERPDLAMQFIEYMRSPPAIEIFGRYGFQPAP